MDLLRNHIGEPPNGVWRWARRRRNDRTVAHSSRSLDGGGSSYVARPGMIAWKMAWRGPLQVYAYFHQTSGEPSRQQRTCRRTTTTTAAAGAATAASAPARAAAASANLIVTFSSNT